MKITEREVAYLWYYQAANNIFYWKGSLIYPVYPGRLSNNIGSDFEDAVFWHNKKRVIGNVEIHVKASQWYKHKHHNDPSYNNVSLHVVMWDDIDSITTLQNGTNIPTISLGSIAYKNSNENKNIDHFPQVAQCNYIGKYDNEVIKKVLNKCGKRKFLNKAKLFNGFQDRDNTEQLVYKQLARSMGYMRNTEPFEKLASELPIRIINGLRIGSLLELQALIIGFSGLMPSQRRNSLCQHSIETLAQQMEQIWNRMNINNSLSDNDWCFFRIRPANSPIRRLIAFSQIIYKYGRNGLVNSLINLIRTAPMEDFQRFIEKRLIINDYSYWNNHSDFGLVLAKGLALLSRQRVGIILVNVVLPFVYYIASISSDGILSKKVMYLYNNYPSFEYNHLIKYMQEKIFINKTIYLSSVQRQGLLYIFKEYCRIKDCLRCPISLLQM